MKRIALGTVEIGMDYGIPSDAGHRRPEAAEAIRFLNNALDLGVTFIDTARVYGNSEELIGEALETRRAEYVLTTKLEPIRLEDLDDDAALRAKVRGSVQESLRRLRTDYIDVLMIHSASRELIARGGNLREMLRELQSEGVARSIGASVYEDAGLTAVECGGFDVVQIGYNALDRSAETAMLPEAEARGIRVVARSVLLKGALTPRYRSLPVELADLQRAAGELDALAHAAGVTLVELAYRYLLSENVLALCGTARVEELREVVTFAERGPLDAALVAEIRRVEVVDRRMLNPGNWPF